MQSSELIAVLRVLPLRHDGKHFRQGPRTCIGRGYGLWIQWPRFYLPPWHICCMPGARIPGSRIRPPCRRFSGASAANNKQGSRHDQNSKPKAQDGLGCTVDTHVRGNRPKVLAEVHKELLEVANAALVPSCTYIPLISTSNWSWPDNEWDVKQHQCIKLALASMVCGHIPHGFSLSGSYATPTVACSLSSACDTFGCCETTHLNVPTTPIECQSVLVELPTTIFFRSTAAQQTATYGSTSL